MNIKDEAKEIEVGQHIVECINVEKGKVAKSGAACKVFNFVVISGKSEGTFIRDRFYIQKKGLAFLARMLLKMGLDDDFNENGSAEYYFNKCAGKRVKVDVTEETYKGRTSKRIKSYLKMSKNEIVEIDDIPRIAPAEYEPPTEVEEEESSGGNGGNYSAGMDDDIPF